MSVTLRLRIKDNPEILENAAGSMNPDNNSDVKIKIEGSEMTVEISKLKISSIYNVSEDILRCFEISKKMSREL